jgi:hypothetical protein
MTHVTDEQIVARLINETMLRNARARMKNWTRMPDDDLAEALAEPIVLEALLGMAGIKELRESDDAPSWQVARILRRHGGIAVGPSQKLICQQLANALADWFSERDPFFNREQFLDASSPIEDELEGTQRPSPYRRVMT